MKCKNMGCLKKDDDFLVKLNELNYITNDFSSEQLKLMIDYALTLETQHTQ